MRKLLVVFTAALLTLCLSVTATCSDVFAIKSVTGVPETTVDFVISVTAGESLQFSASDLERRMGSESASLGGITLTSLPPSSQGILYLDGIALENFDFVSRQELDRLCFVPSEKASGAHITFLPQSKNAVSTSVAIQVLASVNEPPVLEDGVLETVQNVTKQGYLAAYDPEGSSLDIQLIEKPQKGTVAFDGLSFIYQPYRDMTGSDAFTVCAVDSAGAYSREATINIQIDKYSSGFSYVDMNNNPSAYAALMLHQYGVMTGEKIGASYFFHPDEMTKRGDFLVMLIAASGLDATLQPTVNTGLPNDHELPGWLKPYIRTAINTGILSAEQVFAWSEIPTRAEAVVLIHRASGINDVKDYALSLPDLGDIPEWALHSYKSLAAYKMLDLYGGDAHPYGAVTNSYSADLIWQLYKHHHR